MKKLSTILLVVFLNMVELNSNAQCPTCNFTPTPVSISYSQSKPRALYVNRLLKFNDPNNPSLGIDEAVSLLGVDRDGSGNYDGIFQKENQLLAYAQSIGVQTLILYDVENILNNKTMLYGSSDLETHLRRFIQNARIGGFGITEIAAVVGCGYNVNQVAVYDDGTYSVEGCWIPKIGEFVEVTEKAQNEGKTYNAMIASVKLLKDVYNYNLECRKKAISVDFVCSSTFDRIVSEFEFWNALNHDNAWRNFILLTSYMDCLRINSLCTMHSDIYLGWLHLDSYDDQEQADFIDVNFDRVMIHSYRCDPADLFPYASAPSTPDPGRLELFGNSSSMKPNTEIWPIFSAESSTFNDSYNNWCDFLGGFLRLGGINNIAYCENIFQNDYDLNSSSWDNTIGGYTWFTSSFMISNSLLRIRESKDISHGISFSLYPNPASNNIEIAASETFTASLVFKLKDINGLIILQKNLVDQKTTVDILKLKSGTYMFSIVDQHSCLAEGKLIVEK